jgi:broad specificity phosphatase PhoE
MTTWYIIRHAEKETGDFFNPRLRHQDEPINPLGQQTAQRLAGYFADKSIAAVYVSAYRRTWQTAEPVARQFHLTPVVDERLNEIDNGRLDGMSDQAIQQTYPEVWQAFVERAYDFRFPDGETGAEAQQRIVSFLEEKRRRHSDENVIAVCHEALIRLWMCTLLNLPVYRRWDFRIDFGGIVEIAYQPDYDSWKLIRFNQTCG